MPRKGGKKKAPAPAVPRAGPSDPSGPPRADASSSASAPATSAVLASSSPMMPTRPSAAPPPSTPASTRAALMDHADALRDAEREREALRALLDDAEGGMRTLLDVNARLKREVASLEAKLATSSEGFRLLRRERADAASVLASSAALRAALDDERVKLAAHRDAVASRLRAATDALAGASESADASRLELERADEEGLATDDAIRKSAALALGVLARTLAAARDATRGALDATEAESRRHAEEERTRGAEEAAEDVARVRETIARRDAEIATLRDALADARSGSSDAAMMPPSAASPNDARAVHSASLEPPGPDEQIFVANQLRESAAFALDELDAVRAELGEMRAWKARANEELRATRDANRDLARRAEEAEAEIAALAEGSVERRALPSIGEEEDASSGAATANAAVSPPPRPLPSDARGPGPDPHAAANGESSDALTREMWAELQRARARYDALLGKHARQSRRLRRAARGLGVPRGEPPEDLDELELELELELSDPTDDSARSEDDAGRAERRGGLFPEGPGARGPRRSGARRSGVGVGFPPRAQNGDFISRGGGGVAAPEEVEEVEEGMDGEDEVLAEYVTAAPPRGPRGERATAEAMRAARLASGARPASGAAAPSSSEAFRIFSDAASAGGVFGTRAGGLARALGHAGPAASSPPRPESAPSAARSPAATFRVGRRDVAGASESARRPESTTTRVDDVERRRVDRRRAPELRPSSATPSHRSSRGSDASDGRLGGRSSRGAATGRREGEGDAYASFSGEGGARPKTAPSSQHPRRRVAFRDDDAARSGSGLGPGSGPGPDRPRARSSRRTLRDASEPAAGSRPADWRSDASGSGSDDAARFADDSDDERFDPTYDPFDDSEEDPTYLPPEDPDREASYEEPAAPGRDRDSAYAAARRLVVASSSRRRRAAPYRGDIVPVDERPRCRGASASASAAASRGGTPAGSPGKPAFRPAGAAPPPSSSLTLPARDARAKAGGAMMGASARGNDGGKVLVRRAVAALAAARV